MAKSLKRKKDYADQNQEANTLDDTAYFLKVAERNKDASGMYRALKYERVLGTCAPQGPNDLTLVQAHPASRQLAEFAEVMNQDGAVVLQQLLDKHLVEEMRAAHENLLTKIAPELDALRAFTPPSATARAFYQVERKVNGLRLRRGTAGRLDLKSLDRRDGGKLVREDTDVSERVEQLICVEKVRQILSRCIKCPWRIMRVGSILADPGAAAQDWHRDIGDGLFGEDVDMELPDYYFNLLIPLDAACTWQNGTEFVLGSHKVKTTAFNAAVQGGSDDPVKACGCQLAVPNASVGDAVLFNGKVLHRGLPNQGRESRSMLYIVFCAQWYEQNRDPSQEYWVGDWSDVAQEPLMEAK